ncbi:MAG: DHA2 family efflux MFS transporter permease subunit [Burkholderiales bacterium]
MITVSTMLAVIMQALDTTIANVALPHMQGSLQSSQDQIAWVLTSYIVAVAIATPLAGWLCGRWGRRRVFLVAVVGFTAASALCGLAMNLWEMVSARLLQGVFGAALVPLSQAVMLDINPKEKVGQAMAVWGAGIMVGPIFGPILGGWLTEHADWRWVFFINLPVGVLAFYGIARYLPESRPPGERLDLFGFAMLSLGVGLLQLCLDRGAQLDWFNSIEIRLEAAGCVVALAYFVVHTWTSTGASFLDRELLRDRNFVTGCVCVAVLGAIMYATMALLPSLLQGVLGYPVVVVGEVTAPRGLGMMLTMIMVGRVMHRVDGRALMACGFALNAYSLYQMTHITLDMDTDLVVLSGFVQGIGLGMSFVPLTTIAFATLAPRLRNGGTPIYSLMRNIGSSVGISLVQMLYTEGAARSHAGLASDITPYNPVLQGLPPMLDAATPAGLAALNIEVTRQAAMMAYVADFHVMMLVTLAALPLLLFIRKPGGGAVSDGPVADAAH